MRYARPKTKFYAKVEDEIYDLFDQEDVRLTYRMVYMALSGCLLPNSEFAKATFNELRRKSGASSDQTISKALKELSEKGFISKMGESTYRLWHCVYKGIREDQKEYSELREPTTPSVVIPTTPSVVPHARVILFKKTKELQHETDDVNIKNLVFEEGSPFKDSVPRWQWSVWIQEYKFEWCQKMIKEIQHSYRKNYGAIQDPIKLMAKALKMGNVWQLEKKRMADCKKQEDEWKRKKEWEKGCDERWAEVEAERKSEYEKDDKDYSMAIKQPYLIRKAEEKIRSQYPGLEENTEIFVVRLKMKLINLYRESVK